MPSLSVTYIDHFFETGLLVTALLTFTVLFCEPGADLRGRSHPTEVSSCTMIFYNLENNIRDKSPFCRPLFCHISVVNYTSSLLLVNP